ncbi:DUF456 domain-containing protein [Candidatus Nanosalina sp. VS9-1]|uniref:DUF456 domain-containing protein n=1 Tax=Candidatus Nanosalina sp. VS9-1 TaxID=3388566 RepID=UPI0039E0B0DC
MDYFLIAALLLLIIGVAGSIIPGMPGLAASLLGVGLYWWSTGYTEPGALFLWITAFLGATGLIVDWFSGAITAKAGGASGKTSVAAGIAGFIGFFILGGPIGVIIASGLTVFIREYLRTGDMQKSRKAGIYSALGILASTFTQALIAVTILAGFVIAVIF